MPITVPRADIFRSDGFYDEWIKHKDQYDVLYVELFCLADLKHRAASMWLRVQATLLCLVAESVPMLLFCAHSVLHQGSAAMAFTFSTEPSDQPLRPAEDAAQQGPMQGDDGRYRPHLSPLRQTLPDCGGVRSALQCSLVRCSVAAEPLPPVRPSLQCHQRL